MVMTPNAYPWSLLIKNDGRIMFSQKSINLISSVSLDVNSISLFINENYTLKASTVPEGLETESLLWESSDEKVATVADGIVHAIAPGEADITARSADGEVEAVCHVSVGRITSMISLSLSSSGIYQNGYFTGSFQSSLNNKSNKDILVTRFEVIDSKTNKIVTYTENADELGILHSNSSKSIGGKITGVYMPILKWYFTYNGEEYQLSYNLQP